MLGTEFRAPGRAAHALFTTGSSLQLPFLNNPSSGEPHAPTPLVMTASGSKNDSRMKYLNTGVFSQRLLIPLSEREDSLVESSSFISVRQERLPKMGFEKITSNMGDHGVLSSPPKLQGWGIFKGSWLHGNLPEHFKLFGRTFYQVEVRG